MVRSKKIERKIEGHAQIDREEVLETLINRQPFVPIKKMSSPTEENLEKKISGIIDTMKNFPKYQIAKLKLEIGAMVGQIEMDMAKAESEMQTVQVVYVDNSQNVENAGNETQGLGNETRDTIDENLGVNTNSSD